MILNLPTPEALEATALKLHFRAWHGIVTMLRDFDRTHQTDIDEWLDPEGTLFADERTAYLETAQDDLHAILAVVQQSNEIALKARIVEVDPCLLLLKNDVELNEAGKDVEFSSLRTLDAVDLPKAVNALTQKSVSSDYTRRYGELRVQRNRYAHLGDTSAVLDPVAMCAGMAEQYLELWPGRPWLRDRVEATHGREHFFDGKHWSPKQEILFLLDYEQLLIPAPTFRKLFGVKKASVAFGCHKCQDDWAISRNGPALEEASTAFYVGERKTMRCLACDEEFAAVTKACENDGCEGSFAASDDAEFGAGKCFSCGTDG